MKTGCHNINLWAPPRDSRSFFLGSLFRDHTSELIKKVGSVNLHPIGDGCQATRTKSCVISDAHYNLCHQRASKKYQSWIPYLHFTVGYVGLVSAVSNARYVSRYGWVKHSRRGRADGSLQVRLRRDKEYDCGPGAVWELSRLGALGKEYYNVYPRLAD